MGFNTALVTGGAGFIGSHMVDNLLAKGMKVRVLDNFVCGKPQNLEHQKDNPNLEVFEKDIRDLREGHSPLFEGVDVVFHFAGIGDIVPSIEKPLEYMEVNVQGTANVVECAKNAGVKKLVYAASSSCYGLAEETPTTEKAPIQPQYPYALSKFMGEQTAFHWSKVYQLPVSSVRIFNAYGTRSKTSGAYGAVFGVFLKQKLAGKKYTVVGDGSQRRDFLYVTDVAEAFYQVAAKGRDGEFYNLGAGNPQSVNYLVELLKGEHEFIPKRPGEPDVTWASIEKISTDTGWMPQVSFEQGVQNILNNISYWEDAPLWDKESIKNATETWFKYLS